MKKALIVHGFEASGQSNWFPWLARQLRRPGGAVRGPNLPNSAHPDFDETMDLLRELTADFGSDDFLIGHSLGCFWVLKLAEERGDKRPFGGLHLVAPAVGDLPYDFYRANWGDGDLDALERVVSRGVDFSRVQARQRLVWFCEDDQWIPLQNAELFDGWQGHIQRGYGHYCLLQLPGVFGGC